ncbi:MAG: SRPBCC domain-containing protein [Gemmatales bacterium]|nr:SRPBCC domain-containing protein [Gemmatales bacterium]MDW7995247.1 SRPBCC domain-containing protein [Gemmatales bacterium]
MLRLVGDYQLAAPREVVLKRLKEMHFVVRCIPDLARVEHLGEREARLVVRPGFSFLRGEMTVHLQREEMPDQEASSWGLELRGIGSSAQVRVQARVSAQEESRSVLHYEVALEQVGGLLRAVHSSLLHAAMQQTVNNFLAQMAAQLARNQAPR